MTGKCMRRRLVGLLLASGLTGCEALVGHRAPTARQQRISGPLRVSAANARYFADTTGRVVYLTGSHTWEELQGGGTHDPPPACDYERFLNSLVGHGHNLFRLWRWEQARGKPRPSLPYWL